MTKCEQCNIEGFMPIHVEEYYQETVIDTWFCSIQCMKKYSWLVK